MEIPPRQKFGSQAAAEARSCAMASLCNVARARARAARTRAAAAARTPLRCAAPTLSPRAAGRPRAWLFTKLLYAGIIHRVMVHVSAAANVEHVAAPPGFKLEGDDEFMFAFHAAVDPQNHTLLAFAHKE
uniref:Uncharacterized protein n=1 Tax=Emiliania huxleyi TaxID=2903 RepID=A0A7S3TS44_EMIHU|mmetsp:Transcript_33294/g.99611  ORF Transcript_33294/g.99611 Transcript_33294/m.99611 type:complete len:130 (-) Transcript_33294:364-753(-)